MNNTDVVKELNAYLKGEYMGIHAYEQYIENVKDPTIKTALQQIQQDHKQHAAKVAERIQSLGGRAVDGNGFKGAMAEVMMNIKGYPDTIEEILKGVIKGQQMGMEKTKEIIEGDLDSESLRIVEMNLAEDGDHIEQLNNLLH